MEEVKISRVVCVIHARGGSTRIPLKNIRLLNGKPLISYTIKASLSSKLLDRVIVSTDHPEIKKVSLEYGAEVPFDRPKEISWDCPSELVTQHAIKFIEEEQEEKVDIAVTMQPTTPFCHSEDIDFCVKMLQDNAEWKSTFSGCYARERPEWLFKVDENMKAELFMGSVIRGEIGISQTLPKLVLPNGAIYATRREELFGNNLIISAQTGVHIMPFERSVDIDEPVDFEFAEFLAQRMFGKNNDES